MAQKEWALKGKIFLGLSITARSDHHLSGIFAVTASELCQQMQGPGYAAELSICAAIRDY